MSISYQRTVVFVSPASNARVAAPRQIARFDAATAMNRSMGFQTFDSNRSDDCPEPSNEI